MRDYTICRNTYKLSDKTWKPQMFRFFFFFLRDYVKNQCFRRCWHHHGIIWLLDYILHCQMNPSIISIRPNTSIPKSVLLICWSAVLRPTGWQFKSKCVHRETNQLVYKDRNQKSSSLQGVEDINWKEPHENFSGVMEITYNLIEV